MRNLPASSTRPKHAALHLLLPLNGDVPRLMARLERLPKDPYIQEDMLLKGRLYQGIIIMYAQQRRLHLCHEYLLRGLAEGLSPSLQTLQVCTCIPEMLRLYSLCA